MRQNSVIPCARTVMLLMLAVAMLWAFPAWADVDAAFDFVAKEDAVQTEEAETSTPEGDSQKPDKPKEEPTGRTRYAAKKTSMYKSRKTSSKVLKSIPKGAEVYEVSIIGKWAKIKYKGKTGYVKKGRLTSEKPPQKEQEVSVDGSIKKKDGKRKINLVDEDGNGMLELDRSVDRAFNWSGQIVLGEGGMPIPQLFQEDYPQTVCVYGGKKRSASTSGCGAASLSMVIAYLTGNTEQDPYTIFREACQSGMYHGAGLGHEALRKIGKRYGVNGTWVKLTTSELKATLKDGKPVIAHMGEGLFTEGGHYIVLRGVTDEGKILVNDPASKKNTKMAYPTDLFKKETKSSTPYMVCEPIQDKEAALKTPAQLKAELLETKKAARPERIRLAAK